MLFWTKAKDERFTYDRNESVGRQCMNFLVAKEESLVEFYDRYSVKVWDEDEDIKFNKNQIKKAVEKYAEDIKGMDQF